MAGSQMRAQPPRRTRRLHRGREYARRWYPLPPACGSSRHCSPSKLGLSQELSRSLAAVCAKVKYKMRWRKHARGRSLTWPPQPGDRGGYLGPRSGNPRRVDGNGAPE